MRLIKLHSRAVRHGLAVLCTSLLLSSCGLASGRGGLDAGLKYQASGQYRAAYIEAKKVLQRDDKNGKAWLLLGQASLKLGEPKEALNDLQKAQANGVPQAQWTLPMARALLMTQQYDKALATLSADKRFESGDMAQVDVLRGDAYVGLKKLDQAKQSYQAALTLDARNPDALVALAKLAYAAHDADAAAKYVQQALAAAPENPQAWIAKGDLALDSKDFAGAETAYQKVLDFKNPDWLPQEHFYTLSRLANAQAQQNHLDKALTNIEALEKMAPEQPYPHYLHAVVLYKQGHMDGAVSELQQVLKVAPDNTQAQMLMGAVNYAQGNYGQAEMALSNVLGVDQKNVEARRMLALTLYREGRSRQALDTLRPVVPGTPSDSELTAMLQKAATETHGKPGTPSAAPAASDPLEAQFAPVGKALASGNATGAIKLLQAMPAGNATVEARRSSLLVMAYARDNRTNEAVKTAADYAKKHANDSAAHLLYGTALVAAGQRDKARAEYAEAYKLDPKNVAALLSLGSLDTLERHYADADGRYAAVLNIDPHNALALTARGQVAALQGDKASAIKWYKQAITAAPKSPSAYVALTVLYSQSGQFDEAVDTARQLVAANPGNPAALNALGAAQLTAGHHEEALKPLQQATTLAPQVPLYRTNLARAELLNKDPKAAEGNLDKVIKDNPDEVNAVTLRAFMKLQSHDLPGALAMAQGLQSRPATKAAGFALEGDLYMTDKSFGKAAKAYQEGLKTAYERPLVIKRFQALNASGAKDPEGVLRDWLAKHPDDAATRLLLAQYYMDRTQNALAASEYELVLKAHPTSVGALNNLAWIYAEQHNPKALTLAEQAYKLAPQSPGVADTYAWALITSNQPKTALPILEKAAKAAPKEPSIQYHLAVAQARTGDKAGARATLEALQKSGADFQEKKAAETLYREVASAGASAGK
ncbi:MAG TPA: XrtA/PEP-CTERM system TPR-repeat protein PrsT [Rhodanobacter sp.]|nr:XrtA/PEP-CTERM system TPR-repeat protein PrsT [Rhodanobacter sp.]